MLGPLIAHAKMRGYDIEHEQEMERESEDGMLRKIIVGMYMEKLALKQGEGHPGYDPMQAAMADLNATLWSTLRNISQNRQYPGNTGRPQDISPTKSASSQIPTGRQQIGGGPRPTFTNKEVIQTWPNQGQGQGRRQGQNGDFRGTFQPPRPGYEKPIPNLHSVFQRPDGRLPGQTLNPLMTRAGNNGYNAQGQGQGQEPPPWPQFNQRPRNPPPQQVYIPTYTRDAYNPQNTYNPQSVNPTVRNPPPSYVPQNTQVYNPQNPPQVDDPKDHVSIQPPTTPSPPPPPDVTNNDQNNDHGELEEILPPGTKILPSHIPKILDILQVPVPPTMPRVIVDTQIDGVQPGNNNEPARMVNIPSPTENIKTGTEFLQQEVSTDKTIFTESTSSAFGIVVACMIGIGVIAGPAVCIACRVRKKVKERERRKAAAMATRDEESGIMEAIIMSELGRSKLNCDERRTNGARPKIKSEGGTFHELQALRSGRASPPIIVH